METLDSKLKTKIVTLGTIITTLNEMNSQELSQAVNLISEHRQRLMRLFEDNGIGEDARKDIEAISLEARK